jgi:hypothetical protein
MTKIGLAQFLFIMLFVSASAYGQKVKYKDIFALLNTKQYEQAEPFLRKYLKENDDNPNAYLFMGVIFQERAMKSDVLKATRASIVNMDSAILFYAKTLTLITEKEVRRNDEYYQMYNRRDLRTGEFGVKLSDIQFDLQKRTESLKERIDKVKMVKYHFTLADSLYKKTSALFVALQAAYPGQRELYLRADDKTLKDLGTMITRFDSCTKAFEFYKSSAAALGKTGYNQTLALREIRDFKADGASKVDFYQDDLQVWDYKKFAEQGKQVIEKEIMPMRDHLVAYDIEINKLREKLTIDSASVRNDLTKLIDKLLYDQLRRFDPEPLPMEVFTLKTADLEYRSALIESKPFRDSADVNLKLSLITKEMKYLHKLDSIATKLNNENLDEEVLNYSHFITNTYSNNIILRSYIKALKEYAEREKVKKVAELAQRTASLNWIVDQQDSVPLMLVHPTAKYKPLALVADRFTAGLAYTDSLTMEGYFYSIKASRKPEVKARFAVDKPSFRLSKLPLAKTLTYSDGAGQIYFVLVYSEKANKEKYPASLAKIYRSDGLAWSYNYQLNFVPKEIIFKPDTGELTLKGETLNVVVDKNGKMVK